MSVKRGRPTDNPKGNSIHIRLDQKSNGILKRYAEQEKISIAESVRKGIARLEQDIKK